MKQYEIKVSGIAPCFYPTDTYYGLFWYDEENALELPKRYPYEGEWGECLSTCVLLREMYPMPHKLSIAWLSIVEKKFYVLEESFPKKAMELIWEQSQDEKGNLLYSHIIVGMASYGGIALWFHGEKKAKLLAWLYADETEIDIEEFAPTSLNMTLDEICDFYINNDSRVKENLAINGLPPRDLFDNYMKQFTYRYLPLFEHWDEDAGKWTKYTEEEQGTKPELDFIEEALYDGTHDKLHDGGLLNYHEAGKPKKLAIKWHIKKSEYTAYFWFDDEAIRAIFDKFYGIHPDTKTDFIIHIDPEKKKYQLALYRYGLQEPKTIPEDAYQLIVFKNKFEQYRSPNYDQPRGAWIW